VGGERGRRVNTVDKQQCLDLSKEAQTQGCPLRTACQDLGIDLKTLHRWQNSLEDQRHGPLAVPANKLSDGEKSLMIKTATAKEYHDISPWQIVARLADQGTYIASEASFYRVLKERDLLAHRRKSKRPNYDRPSPLVAMSPNQIWSWDITYLKTAIKGEHFYLYLFMDIFSRKIVGFEVYDKESMDYSSMLFADICEQEGIDKNQLTLHSDNGGSMKGATMLATLQKLGVVPSFSRPGVSDDNPYSESLFKTLKYCPGYPLETFQSIEMARAWVKKFVEWYNNTHLHSGIKFVTPSQRHEGLDREILIKRKKVYERAKQKNPQRWSGSTRNWNFIDEVYLNHLQRGHAADMKLAA
jgi:transposase InsO family protein